MRIPTGCEETRYAVDRLLVVGHGWSGADFSVHLTHYVVSFSHAVPAPWWFHCSSFLPLVWSA